REALEQEQIGRGKAEKLAEDNKKLAADEHRQRVNAENLAKANKLLALQEAAARKEADRMLLRMSFEHYLSHAERNVRMVGSAKLLPKAVALKDDALADSIRLHLSIWTRNRNREGTAIVAKRRFDHGTAVNVVAFSPDGKNVLTVGDDPDKNVAGKEVRLWDV